MQEFLNVHGGRCAARDAMRCTVGWFLCAARWAGCDAMRCTVGWFLCGDVRRHATPALACMFVCVCVRVCVCRHMFAVRHGSCLYMFIIFVNTHTGTCSPFDTEVVYVFDDLSPVVEKELVILSEVHFTTYFNPLFTTYFTTTYFTTFFTIYCITYCIHKYNFYYILYCIHAAYICPHCSKGAFSFPPSSFSRSPLYLLSVWGESMSAREHVC
jgi:hypothetical protein